MSKLPDEKKVELFSRYIDEVNKENERLKKIMIESYNKNNEKKEVVSEIFNEINKSTHSLQTVSKEYAGYVIQEENKIRR